MERKELTEKVILCIKNSLSDIKNIDKLTEDTLLMSDENNSGLFDNSLCILEVTSSLVTEFEIDPSIFKKESFKNVSSLVDTIEEGLKNKEKNEL
jgi:hypothetical protein